MCYPKLILMKQLKTASQVRLSLVLLIITASTAASATFRTFPYCDRTFSCGSIQNITYPFTGGARPHYCGLPKFQLTCKNNSITELTSDSVTYRVLHINQTLKTLSLSASNFSISGFDEFYSDPHEDQCSNCSWVGGRCGFDSNSSLPICICEDVQCPIPTILQSSDSAKPTASHRILQSSDSAPLAAPSTVQQSSDSPVASQSSDLAPLAASPAILQSTDSTSIAVSPAILQSSDPPMASPPILQSSDLAAPADSPAIFQPSDSADSPSGRSNLALILGIAVPIGGTVVILLLWIMIKKLAPSESPVFCRAKTQNDRNIEACLKNCGSLSPKRYTYSDIKKMTNSFRTKLGQGGFGCVFKGKLENGCFVAVKVLKGLKGGGEDFINEVATISGTSHVNIVTLLGFCFEGRHRALIYEFMPNGSLDKFIQDGDSSTHCQLGWERLYQIAVGIARGLEYLHRGCKTRILHFDIKPHNILLNEDFCPKICDFGNAKLCPQKESIISLLGTRGTVGYIAPEVFSRHFGGVSYKSDVYSYGMMVLEIVGGRKKTHFEVDGTSEIYFPHWVYKRLELDEEFGLHGIMDDEARVFVRKMIIVGLWCIQTNPSDRPSMSRVVEMLEGSLESLQIPPKPFMSSPSRSPVEYSSSTQSEDTVVAES